MTFDVDDTRHAFHSITPFVQRKLAENDKVAAEALAATVRAAATTLPAAG